MLSLEETLNIPIPKSIADIIDYLPFHLDHLGKSESTVVLFEDYVLKISSLSFDIDNEWKNYLALKDKLPIAEILCCENSGDKLFVLKKKLQGKPLCDDYYLSRPDLLFILAKKAIEMLWSVDIRDLHLQDTFQTIVDFGEKANQDGLLHFESTNKEVTEGFADYDEILDYILTHKSEEDPVLCHGDLCLPNIICDEDRIVGFIDMGLTGISHRYHDLAILYRSIKNNFRGCYGGKPYPGFEEGRLFNELGVEKKNDLIRYFQLLDELLG